MTAITVEKQTAEPGKRVLRTILAGVIGTASALPVILGAIVLPKGTELATVVADIGVVSTGVSGLMANPKINALLAKVGLGATTVKKLQTATLAAADPASAEIAAALEAYRATQAQLAAGNVSAAVETAGDAAAQATSVVQSEIPLVESAVAATS